MIRCLSTRIRWALGGLETGARSGRIHSPDIINYINSVPLGEPQYDSKGFTTSLLTWIPTSDHVKVPLRFCLSPNTGYEVLGIRACQSPYTARDAGRWRVFGRPCEGGPVTFDRRYRQGPRVAAVDEPVPTGLTVLNT